MADDTQAGGAGPKKAYSFYDGPPFATGLPHYGHLLAGTLKRHRAPLLDHERIQRQTPIWVGLPRRAR
jgi:hypothetical protein